MRKLIQALRAINARYFIIGCLIYLLLAGGTMQQATVALLAGCLCELQDLNDKLKKGGNDA